MPNRHAMNWGLLVGLVFCLNFWMGTIPFLSWMQYVIIPAEVYLIYRLARHCRDTELDGYATYGQMLWYIVQLALYASLISALFKYLYCKVLVARLSRQPNRYDALAGREPANSGGTGRHLGNNTAPGAHTAEYGHSGYVGQSDFGILCRSCAGCIPAQGKNTFRLIL